MWSLCRLSKKGVITTEKVDTELEAPASGTIAELSVEADSEVPVGEIIAYIEKE